MVFIDDIITYSKSEEDHKLHLREALNTSHRHKLKAKFFEYHFCAKISLLRHVVSKQDRRLNQVKSLQSWIGMCLRMLWKFPWFRLLLKVR